MILYDDKYNFLGMSSHTLGFLGYEDIGDFLSMQSDFANLLVNKEGYIYDFANFNWIDFVLYSGSANKTALVTLKSGQEAKIDLSIKEVHLAHEIAGINKLYSIKLISDNFHEISGVPKSEEKLEKALGGFSLSGLVSKESQNEEIKELEPVQEKVENSTLINEPIPNKVEKKEESFILNIDSSDTTVKEPELLVKEPQIAPEVEEDFKLDIFQQDKTPTQEEISGFTLKTMDEPIKLDESEEEETSFLLPPQEETKKETFGFNLLNEEPKQEVEEQNEEKLDLFSTPSDSTLDKVEEKKEENFVLTSLNTTTEEDKTAKIETISESGFKLDFLKTDLVQEKEDIEEKKETLQQKDNSKIIKQIKRDIKEIDKISETKSEPTFKLDTDNNPLDIPQMPQVEQPLVIKKVQEEKLELAKETIQELEIKQEEVANTNFQTEEKVEESEHPSFENTLKNLFNTPIQEEKEEEPTNIIEIEKKRKKPTIKLTSLGLNQEDEYELLSDFIQDANESIETIEQFIKTEDFDKINYALVKIKSSAEILNLNAIIENAITIRGHCVAQKSESILTDVQKLKENIHLLEEQLEATAL